MKITNKVLSIPPYISARWDYIQSLRVQDEQLIISLKDATSCSIPGLTQEELSQIFTAFATHAEEPTKEIEKSEEILKQDITHLFEGMKKGFSDFVNTLMKTGGYGMSLTKSLEHDPANAHLPILPLEARKRVEMLLQIVSEEDILAMQEPVPNCNCMYCQVQRILRESLYRKHHGTDEEGELVDESELKFTEWSVEPLADKLYLVRNKLNPQEEYRVFLGEPLGCTCGKANCEHIIAVLRT